MALDSSKDLSKTAEEAICKYVIISFLYFFFIQYKTL